MADLDRLLAEEAASYDVAFVPVAAVHRRRRRRVGARAGGALAAVVVLGVGVGELRASTTAAPAERLVAGTPGLPSPLALSFGPGRDAFTVVAVPGQAPDVATIPLLPEQVTTRGETTDLTLRFLREPGTREVRASLRLLRRGANQPILSEDSPDLLRTLTVADVPDDAEQVVFVFDGLGRDGQPLDAGTYSVSYELTGTTADGNTVSSVGPYGQLRVV